MKKTGFVLTCLLVGGIGLYLLVMQPSMGIRTRLEKLQEEEYAQGCKKATSSDVAPAAAEPAVAERDQGDRQTMAKQKADQQPAETGIDCPDVASRANLIAIDSLRMSSFAGIVAYILGFGSLLSIWIAVRSTNQAIGNGVAAGHPFLALRTSTTGLDHATLAITNVGDAALWLRSIHVNDDPAVFGGIAGGILCLPIGGTHVVGTRIRHASGGDRSTVHAGYRAMGGKNFIMRATVVRVHGNWEVEDVQNDEY